MPSQWRQSLAKCQYLDARGSKLPPLLARCLRDSMPKDVPRLLDLLVPRQDDQWAAAQASLFLQHDFEAKTPVLQPADWFSASHRVLRQPCEGIGASAEYLAMSLCSRHSDEAVAPLDGHIESAVFASGSLHVFVVAAGMRRLGACGVELEVHLHVDTPEAPAQMDACKGMSCREQFNTWEGAHFLRYACVVRGADLGGGEFKVMATSFSGLIHSPALHTIITCRLPWHVLPETLASDSDMPGDGSVYVELREMDGVFGAPVPIRLCPQRRWPRKRRRFAVGLRPLIQAADHIQLLEDWLAYHSLIGVDHFYIYDDDGSVEALLKDGPAVDKPASTILKKLRREGRVSYVQRFARQMGERFEKMQREGRRVLGFECIQHALANHCLGMAKSAGFEWFIFLRGLDKFLHSDLVDGGAGMLHRAFKRRPRESQFQLFRRDCGGVEEPRRSLGSLAPVFQVFTRCEKRWDAQQPGWDFSWIPVMRPGSTLCTRSTESIPHNISDSRGFRQPTLISIHDLRAQHFVRAFDRGGRFAGLRNDPRYDDLDPTEEDRFTELDRGMDWAVQVLRERDSTE